jgi:glucuronate isomerase
LVRRNNNSRLFEALGPDAGFDSISDCPQVNALARFLDRLDRENALPKTILYNLNPADNYAFGTMLGNFQDGSVPGKLQLGSGWWFLDQKEAMEWQLNTLSNLGLLCFPRHEYFRRVLCNLIGRDVENGELPDDDALLQPLIENICHRNARMALSLTR